MRVGKRSQISKYLSGSICLIVEPNCSTKLMSCGCAEDLEQRLLERGTHDESLPLPGQLVNADFRDASASAQAWACIAAGRPVRVVQWNIERGIEFDAIVSTLKQLQADVLLIQEVDNGCDRTEGRDVGTFALLKAGTSFVCKRGTREQAHTAKPSPETSYYRSVLPLDLCISISVLHASVLVLCCRSLLPGYLICHRCAQLGSLLSQEVL